MSYLKLLNKIKEFDKICIFRHERPDGDAMFSCLALSLFLKENFKDKKVKVLGNDKFDLISLNEKASDKFIKESLCLVLDCSNANRIDDYHALAGKYVIKIDHHPNVENYADLNIVDEKASATCELLADIFFSKTFKDYKIPKKCLEYLYCGLLTDTLNFKTTNTTAKTLLLASKILALGDFKASEKSNYVFNYDLESFKLKTKIRSLLKVDSHFGYIVLNEKDLMKLNINALKAKIQIDEIGSIRQLNVWCIAAYNDSAYDISIRSKDQYIINTIASKYGGGGHKNACACKKLNKSDLNKLLNDLKKLANQKC